MTKSLGMTIVALVAVGALGYFVTTGVVKPVSTDLSVIGQGQPVLVLAYENFSPTGGAALDRLREIRDEYEPRLRFVVADLGTPQGRAFANRFGLNDGETVFIGPDGEAVVIAHHAGEVGDLRTLIDEKLADLES